MLEEGGWNSHHVFGSSPATKAEDKTCELLWTQDTQIVGNNKRREDRRGGRGGEGERRWWRSDEGKGREFVKFLTFSTGTLSGDQHRWNTFLRISGLICKRNWKSFEISFHFPLFLFLLLFVLSLRTWQFLLFLIAARLEIWAGGSLTWPLLSFLLQSSSSMIHDGCREWQAKIIYRVLKKQNSTFFPK